MQVDDAIERGAVPPERLDRIMRADALWWLYHKKFTKHTLRTRGTYLTLTAYSAPFSLFKSMEKDYYDSCGDMQGPLHELFVTQPARPLGHPRAPEPALDTDSIFVDSGAPISNPVAYDPFGIFINEGE